MPNREGSGSCIMKIYEPNFMIEELKETRKIMSDYPRIANLPLHITEFNSSYVPVCPVYDTTFRAAYIARILSEAGEYADSNSYWTFSDVFEGVRCSKIGISWRIRSCCLRFNKETCIPLPSSSSRKPGRRLLYRDENLMLQRMTGRYAVIGWNWHDGREQAGGRSG